MRFSLSAVVALIMSLAASAADQTRQCTLPLPQSTLSADGCQCPTGGPCICIDGCQCPGCKCLNCQGKLPEVWMFTAEWCPPCHRMKGTTLSSPAVKSACRIVYVDIDTHPDRVRLLSKFQVNAIPKFVRSDGHWLEGYATEAQFLEWLTRVYPK